MVLLLNFLFRENTVFTYTSRNIPLIIGIIFIVSLVPDEYLHVLNVWLQYGQ